MRQPKVTDIAEPTSIQALLKWASGLDSLPIARNMSIEEVTAFNYSLINGGVDLRVLRGDWMLDLKNAYREFAAVFQLPLSFGGVLMALEDSLEDEDWMVNKDGWVLEMVAPEDFLSGDQDSIRTFWRMLMSVKCYWEGRTPARYFNMCFFTVDKRADVSENFFGRLLGNSLS